MGEESLSGACVTRLELLERNRELTRRAEALQARAEGLVAEWKRRSTARTYGAGVQAGFDWCAKELEAALTAPPTDTPCVRADGTDSEDSLRWR